MRRGHIIGLCALFILVTAALSTGPSLALSTEPVATIVEVTPSPAYDTDTITLRGEATYDGVIETYEWKSDVYGVLGYGEVLELTDLPIGVHEISFTVKADNGDWSEPAVTTIEVVNYMLETPDWNTGDCWLWEIYMKDASGDEESMYIIEHVKNADATYSGAPCFEVDLTYTMEGETDIIEGTVWLSKHDLDTMGYEIADMDEPFGAYTFFALFSFPMDVSEGSILFDLEPTEDRVVGNGTYCCVELTSVVADATLTYSPDLMHITDLYMNMEGEIMTFTMHEAMDVGAVYSVLPGAGGSGEEEDDGGSLLSDPMYMGIIVVVLIVIIGGVVFAVVSRRGRAAAQPQPLAGGPGVPPTQFRTMEPQAPARPTGPLLSLDGPPGSLGTPAAPAAGGGTVGPPRELKVGSSPQGNQLTWQPPVGDAAVSFIKVYRGTSPENMQVMQTLAPNATSFLDSSIMSGTIYHYRVAAETIQGTEVSSEPVSQTMGSPPSSPIYPRGVVEGSTVFLEWRPPISDGGSPITGYRVYRGPSAESIQEIASVGPEISYADTEVQPGTYYYGIIAETANGKSPGSKVVEIQVP